MTKKKTKSFGITYLVAIASALVKEGNSEIQNILFIYK